MSLRPLKVFVATSLQHAYKIISSLTFHVKPHCLMIMVLQVGEQGQQGAGASEQSTAGGRRSPSVSRSIYLVRRRRRPPARVLYLG